MPEILQKNISSVFRIHQEYDMSPAKDFHNEFMAQIHLDLAHRLKGSSSFAKIDTFRYLEDWLINSFGDFKNAVQLENFIAGLTRFGAPKSFIRHKLKEYGGMGMASSGYAPDVFIVDRAQRHNEFGIPLLTLEILSQNSRKTDLYFKPYFYETIGVREYFIGEANAQQGTLLQGYCLKEEEYQPIPLENERYYSEVLGDYLPQVWPL